MPLHMLTLLQKQRYTNSTRVRNHLG